MKLLTEITQALEDRCALVVATVVDKKGDGPMPVAGRIMVDEKGNKHGTVGGGALETHVIQTARDLIHTKQHLVVNYDMSGAPKKEGLVSVHMICGGQVTVFFEYMAPKPRLFIFGSGNVGGALLSKMSGTEFDLVVSDQERPENLGKARFIRDLSEAISWIDADAFVVISTGAHTVDYDILKAIIQAGVTPHYMGMLASKLKVATMFENLKAQGVRVPHDLYSPIGYDLGANTPDEIAIAIAAQLIGVRNGKATVKDMHL